MPYHRLDDISVATETLRRFRLSHSFQCLEREGVSVDGLDKLKKAQQAVQADLDQDRMIRPSQKFDTLLSITGPDET